MLGVLACPNLPLSSIADTGKDQAHTGVGCLFYAKIGAGTFMQSLDGSSSPVKVGNATIVIINYS